MCNIVVIKYFTNLKEEGEKGDDPNLYVFVKKTVLFTGSIPKFVESYE
jgi:hypothetical protein